MKSSVFYKLRLIITLPLMFLLQLAPYQLACASEYKVELYEHLCEEVNNPESYTTSVLKSLKFLVEGEDGWVFRSRDDFLENFRDKNTDYKALGNLVEYLASQGTQLLLIYVPTRGLMNPDSAPEGYYNYATAIESYTNKLQKLRSLGVIVPDFPRLITQNQGTDFFFKRDIHWTPNGALQTAKFTAAAIHQAGLASPSDLYEFVTTPTGLYTIDGAMGNGMKQICGQQYIPEFAQSFSTSASLKTTENDLFADEPALDTVLLGTSFSDLKRLNFIGTLQENLGTPIINHASPGGGDDGAWLNYAISGDFIEAPPKLIIWEVPSYYHLDDASVFAQILPRLRGDYQQQPALVEEQLLLSSLLANQKQSLFFTDSLVDVPLDELVIDIAFSRPDIRHISFNIWYSNGKVKRARIKNPQKATTNGRFLFSLFANLLEPQSSMVAIELIEIEKKSIEEFLRENDRDNSNSSVAAKVYRVAANK